MCNSTVMNNGDDDKDKNSIGLVPNGKSKVVLKQGNQALFGRVLSVGFVFVVAIMLVGMFLAVLQVISPSTIFPLYFTAAWYFGEIVVGLVMIAHVFIYPWAVLFDASIKVYFKWLYTLTSSFLGISLGSIAVIMLWQKNIIAYTFLVVGLMMFCLTTDFIYFRRGGKDILKVV
jgi:hypothetical protein